MGDGKALTHGYRTLQEWNQWLTQEILGRQLLQAEQEVSSAILNKFLGKHGLTVGVPHQANLLQSTTIPCQTLISPLVLHEKVKNYIESDFHDLPIATGSIDIVLLPHSLEFTDKPRKLLADACRIVKPEGLIVIYGFNPYSIWGLKKAFAKPQSIPWSANFLHAHKVKSWLHLSDFALEQEKAMMFLPPINYENFYQKFHFIETTARKYLPFLGGVYILVARAKIIPLTPIRLRWKQRFSGIHISPTTGYMRPRVINF